jgi:aryl-alcohol dehydrogenase-like predicted oxidoreductase
METRSFGNNGMEVGVVGFGTAEIGFEEVADRTLDAIFGVAFDMGINVIDTAAMYGDSEEKIGRALRGRRSQCFLCTKCGRYPPRRRSIRGLYERARRRAQYRLMRSVDEHDSLDWQPRVLEWNIDQSLRRLSVDCIDVVLLHSCSEETLRRGVVIEVLRRARQAGKVRYIGFSGDGPAALYAVQCRQFEVLETSVNIADQEVIDSTVPLAIQHGMGVIAKRPIANGVWKSNHRPEVVTNHAYWDRLRELQYDFLQDGRAFETALRFTLSVSGVHTAIVGTANPAHLRRDAESVAAGLLAKDQFDAIRARWKKVARPDWVGQT